MSGTTMTNVWTRQGLRSLAVSLAFAAATSGSVSAASLNDVDAYVENTMHAFDIPGLSIAIVKNGHVELVKGYGVRRLGTSLPVDASTQFNIGSTTKAFTTGAIALLAQDGRLNWDDHVVDHMPGFEMYDPWVTREMTVTDMLVHRSGLGLGEGDLLIWPRTINTRAEVVHQLRYLKPETSFRSGFAYDNLLYIAAGQLIANVSGSTWEEFVQHRILSPLGMRNTTVTPTDFAKSADHALPHSMIDGKLQPTDIELGINTAGPTGGVNSCATDIAKWLLAQLNAGNQGSLFTKAAQSVMWRPETLISPGMLSAYFPDVRPNFLAYTPGWFIQDYRGHRILQHPGSIEGFEAAAFLLPENNSGFFIMLNSNASIGRAAIAYHVLDALLDLPPEDWLGEARKIHQQDNAASAKSIEAAEASRHVAAGPSLPLQGYVGQYRDAWYGPVSVKLVDGRLQIAFERTPGMVADLDHWQYDTFRTRWHDKAIAAAYVTFALKPDGSTERVSMAPVSPDADFSFDYRDLHIEPATISDARP